MRRTLRSTTPRRSAVQPSALSVIRLVELGRLRLHRGDGVARELVRVGLELELAGEIPLVEREQRAPARGAPTHRAASA